MLVKTIPISGRVGEARAEGATTPVNSQAHGPLIGHKVRREDADVHSADGESAGSNERACMKLSGKKTDGVWDEVRRCATLRRFSCHILPFSVQVSPV